ncbi:MAG: glycosyltransferase family 2 protein [Rhodothermales bacterium]
MRLKTAIVTTLIDADATLASFIQYHLHIGFDHLFLFFDDPNAVLPGFVKDNPKISSFQRNEALENAWETTTSYLTPQISRSINSEAMSRQSLNAELALREAFHMEIDWLLHIDIDELFYPARTTVHKHFNMLQDRDIHCILYPNMEGIPEKKEVSDFFTEVTLFKVNPEINPNKSLINDHKTLLNNIPQIPPSFFHYYSSHKSAVRVFPNTMPKGVHNFSTPKGGTRKKFIDGPMILHFPCCGIAHFKQKYKTLGAFGNQWFGNGSNFHIKLDAHLNGRDIVGTKNDALMESYYLNTFVLSDQVSKSALLHAGLCRRIQNPAKMLHSLQKEVQHEDVFTDG